MSLLTAQQIARVSVALLGRALVLPRTTTRVPGEEYAGPSGGTVTLRVRVPRTARVQASPGDQITMDGLEEVSVPVTLAHLYNGTNLTDEDLTLTLESFAEQVAAPMVGAIARGAEDRIAAVMNAMVPDLTFDDLTATTIDDAILAAREQLGRAEVPLGNRWLAVSPEFATAMLGDDNESNVNEAGTPSALRDAVIDRRRGFVVVESSSLAPGAAVAYHQSAFAMGLRAPVNAPGAASSASASEDGIALRVLRDFDITRLSEGVVASTFAGAAAVLDKDPDPESGSGEPEPIQRRAVRMQLAEESGS